MDKLAWLDELSKRYEQQDGRHRKLGNASCKRDDIMYIKTWGDTDEEYVRFDLRKLRELQRSGATGEQWEQAQLAGQGCPAKEYLPHALLPFEYVVYLDSPLAAGFASSQQGGEKYREILGENAIWVSLRQPGYELAKACFDAIEQHQQQQGSPPQLLVLQNHGLLVAAETAQQVEKIVEQAMEQLQAEVRRHPDFSAAPSSEKATQVAPVLRMLYSKGSGKAVVVYQANQQVMQLVGDRHSAEDLQQAVTPLQAAYCGRHILFVDEQQKLVPAYEAFCERYQQDPGIVLVQGVGMFALAGSKAEAEQVKQVFLHSISLVVYAGSFGGVKPLSQEVLAAVERVEPALNEHPKRMQGKICVVTGAAQGFGEGIARGIAEQGGYVVVADMNADGARAMAEKLESEHGDGVARGVAVNVADEESVRQMVRQTVLQYGGLDVMVSCAGILVAGGLDSMTLANFEKVTAVNYTGYFLCAKYAVEPMKIQRQHAPAYTSDVIEINSKSGLEGSKNNFVYAGSKFGGVGLTQSFALELAEFGIKVNAVCPGNLLDGPLWSDPERGLFRQYLDAGKVPGAKTVEDVRKFYEAKVPMGRGCTVEDVARAIFYLVEQQYETGQALPVTGGQVMLS